MTAAGFWSQALAVARRDVVLERRAGEVAGVVIPFGAVAILLFPIAVGPNRPLLSTIGAGLFWTIALIIGVQVALRHSSLEGRTHRDLMAQLGAHPAAQFAGRAAATAVWLLAFELALGLLTIVLYQPDPISGWITLLVAVMAVTVGMSLLVSLIIGAAADARSRRALVPLLVIPLALPLLLGGTGTVTALQAGQTATRWLVVLVFNSVVLAVLGMATAGELAEAQ